MTFNELESYFETLELSQKAIGVNRQNRKHLQRIENIKELLLMTFGGLINSDFEGEEDDIREFDQLVKQSNILSSPWNKLKFRTMQVSELPLPEIERRLKIRANDVIDFGETPRQARIQAEELQQANQQISCL